MVLKQSYRNGITVVLSAAITFLVGCSGGSSTATLPGTDPDSSSSGSSNTFIDNQEFETAYQQDNYLDEDGLPPVSTRFSQFVADVPTPELGFPGTPTEDIELTGEFAAIENPNGSPDVQQALPVATEGFEPFSFVNYETPHVYPMDIDTESATLLAVNTADNALMIFDVSSGAPVYRQSVPVGIDPVSVRFRTASEAWVVNHISDTVSIVDLDRGLVIRTLQTSDEPTDVVFAGSPQKAFVSASQVNRLDVFDIANLDATPASVPILGEDPRMLAVSPDGNRVYAAIFESGNSTTLVAGGKRLDNKVLDAVRRPEGPYGGRAVPPNNGDSYSPPINPALPAPVATSIIVRKDDEGRWLDDNEGDWTRLVSGDLSLLSNRVEGWDLPDNDVAIVDANNLALSYQKRLMNMVMALGVNPVSGELFAVGTEATNEVRWEPNLKGTFVRPTLARFQPEGSATVSDLNPHLDYSTPIIPASQRELSIGDPRGVAFTADGQSALITGMGSDNVVVLDSSGNRTALLEVGEGPTGVVVDDNLRRAYVLNKFSGSISVIDLNSWSEEQQVPYFDPTPADIKQGRPILYNTHLTSGLGQTSCASCHVDARTDRLVWDLGDPTANMGRRGNRTFHPMKGPMKTQTFQDIIGVPAMHHSGDKDNIFGFANAFPNLQGTEQNMDSVSMARLEAMLDTVHYPPNPNRNIDNSLSTRVQIQGPNNTIYAEGDALAGFQSFRTGVGTGSNCFVCHGNARTRSDIVKGANNGFINSSPLISENLRGFYDRMGMFRTSVNGSTSGFGFLPDGSQASELIATNQNFDALRSQSGLHVHAFLLSIEGPLAGMPGLARDSHAGVGQQVTISSSSDNDDLSRLDALISIANSGNVGLVGKGSLGNIERGVYYIGQNMFQSDRVEELFVLDQILDAVRNNDVFTFTLVPIGSQYRIGVDADVDGILNRDETDNNQNPRLPNDSTWTQCATDGGTCDFDGTAAVRFGANEDYVYGVHAGGVACNVGVFGDNRSGDSMSCWVSNYRVSTPPPLQACNAIDFNTVGVVRYSSTQDRGNHEVLEDGNALRVFNNGWKAVPLSVEVGPDTVIEFEFRSSIAGEEHAIGLDQDLNFSDQQRFKLFGTQDTSGFAFQNYANYDGSGSYRTYAIRAGESLSGTFSNLVFTADHDAAPGNGESVFRNVRVYNDPEGDGCNPPPPIVTTPPDVQPGNGTRSNAVEFEMTIDGIHAEWTNLTSFGTDAQDLTAGIDFLEAWIANDSSSYYFAHRMAGSTPLLWGHSVYLDTDQSRDTGFTGFDGSYPIGADYILEGGSLLRYTGLSNTEWSWEEIGQMPASIVGSTIEVQVPMNALSDSEAFDLFYVGRGAAANATEDDYFPDTVTNPASSRRYFTYERADADFTPEPPIVVVPPTAPPADASAIVIDGNLDDWANIEALPQDPADTGVSTSIDWHQARVIHDEDNWYLAYEMHNVTPLLWGHTVFIDSDQNLATGFTDFDSSYPLGADYALEGAVLFKFTGTTGNEWSWVEVGRAESAVQGKNIEISLPRNMIDNAVQVDYFFRGAAAATVTSIDDSYPDDVSSFFTYDFSQNGITTPDRPVVEVESRSNPLLDVTLDGDLSDWSAIDPFSEDPSEYTGNPTAIDWVKVSVAHDNSDFYFAYEMSTATSLTWGHSVYLDTDKQKNSGFRGFSGSYPIGADYMLEGDVYFRYIGDGTNWSWEPLGAGESATVGTSVEMKISRTALGDPNGFDMLLVGKGIALEGNTTDYYPDAEIANNAGFLRYNVSEQVVLDDLQQDLFTPVCSVCHDNNNGDGLPGAMDLTSADNTYGALVGVVSIQEPSFDRVVAGDADNSYLIRKLEGTQTIGERMPFEGEPLDSEMINQVRRWIEDGALRR